MSDAFACALKALGIGKELKGLRIMDGLRGYTSGMATPYYVIDLPGGKGKIPILPDDVKREGKILFLRNYLGEVTEYLDDGG